MFFPFFLFLESDRITVLSTHISIRFSNFQLENACALCVEEGGSCTMTNVIRSTNERDLKKKNKKKREREFSNSELAVVTNGGGQYPNIMNDENISMARELIN